jgi:hypothetical protein
MKKGLILPVLAFALVAGACDEDDDQTGPNTRANVRFVNAITGVTGNLALTANGAMVGSALGFGATGSQCTLINSGNTTLAFGTANAGGTGISGTALETMTQNLAASGNYTVIATGTAADPQFVVLNNRDFTGNVPSGQTVVRFVNLVPSLTGGASSTFDVFTGTSTTGTPTTSDLAFAGSSTFSTMPSGSTVFTFTDSDGETIFTNTGSGLNLTSGSVNTVAILPNAAGTGFQLINLTACQ